MDREATINTFLSTAGLTKRGIPVRTLEDLTRLDGQCRLARKRQTAISDISDAYAETLRTFGLAPFQIIMAARALMRTPQANYADYSEEEFETFANMCLGICEMLERRRGEGEPF